MIWLYSLQILAPVLVQPRQTPACQLPEPTACVSNTLSTTEQIIARLESHGKLVYRSGCDGRKPCRENGFDCSGLVIDARRHAWYYTGKKLNSWAMYKAGEPIKYTELQRGDYIRFERIGQEWPDHIAIVTRGRDGETIEIMDMFEKPWYVTKRLIRVFGYGWYTRNLRINAMRLDYNYTVAINRLTGQPYRYKK